ncbi:hypothetical protein [Sporosarcina obsidiansis]|uniref:hypothetical protein n=1 Tax=Sporosarcina obsidiansis TaxID=2660748 RepID=UPI00129B2E01|nr:hypothetical protein [Sporosarcina obsidiansis]
MVLMDWLGLGVVWIGSFEVMLGHEVLTLGSDGEWLGRLAVWRGARQHWRGSASSANNTPVIHPSISTTDIQNPTTHLISADISFAASYTEDTKHK